MSLFCKHDYKILETIEKKSELELLLEAGIKKMEGHADNCKHLVIYKCAKCGKIRETRF